MRLLTPTNALLAHARLVRAGSHLQSAILLFIRLAWGWQLLESGHAHLANVAGTAKNFAEWGIPFPTLNVYLAGSTEMIGGALLMLGLASCLISVPLFFNFCVAYLTASRDTVKHLFTQNPDVFINDAAFPFLVTSVLIFAFGPGKFSVDAIIYRALSQRSRESGAHDKRTRKSPLGMEVDPTSVRFDSIEADKGSGARL